MGTYSIITLVCSIGILLIGFRVFNLDRKNRQYQVFFGFTILLAYLGGCWFELSRTSDPVEAEFWRMCLSVWPFAQLLVFVCCYFFVLHQPRGEYVLPRSVFVGLLLVFSAAAILLSYFHYTGQVRGQLIPIGPNRWSYGWEVIRFPQILSSMYMGLIALFTGYFLFVSARREPYALKRRWKWLLLVTVSGGLLYVDAVFLIFPIYGNFADINQIIPTFISVAVFGWALSDFRLLEFNSLTGYQQVFGLINNPVIVTDRRFVVRMVNPKAMALIGKSELEAMDASLWSLLPVEAAQSLKKAIDQKDQQAEISISHPTQGTVHLLFNVRPISPKPERMTGYVFVGTDTTDYRKAVENAQSYALQLERSNMALERFAYIASHDLKEPLRTVNGFSQLMGRQLDRNPADPAVQESLTYIQSGIQRMYALIDSVLEIARHNEHEPEMEIVDLHVLLEELCAKLSDLINRKGAKVNWEALPKLWGDQMSYYRLFLNLVENGIKYNHRANPCVKVEFRKTDAGLLFQVSDNGPGIEVGYRDRVFEMFQRLQRWEEVEGTGIGLAVCRMIVQEYSGTIWIDESAADGARFNIQLPADLLASQPRFPSSTPASQ